MRSNFNRKKKHTSHRGAEVQEEKERIASSAARQRAELDKLQRQLEENHSSTADLLRKEFDKAREEQERRHTVSFQH